jgi:hypothetical protein
MAVRQQQQPACMSAAAASLKTCMHVTRQQQLQFAAAASRSCMSPLKATASSRHESQHSVPGLAQSSCLAPCSRLQHTCKHQHPTTCKHQALQHASSLTRSARLLLTVTCRVSRLRMVPSPPFQHGAWLCCGSAGTHLNSLFDRASCSHFQTTPVGVQSLPVASCTWLARPIISVFT